MGQRCGQEYNSAVVVLLQWRRMKVTLSHDQKKPCAYTSQVEKHREDDKDTPVRCCHFDWEPWFFLLLR